MTTSTLVGYNKTHLPELSIDCDLVELSSAMNGPGLKKLNIDGIYSVLNAITGRWQFNEYDGLRSQGVDL